jgi:hypothetical protein
MKCKTAKYVKVVQNIAKHAMGHFTKHVYKGFLLWLVENVKKQELT